MKSMVVIDGVRTPFCRAGSSLASLSAADLGHHVVTALLARTGLPVEEQLEITGLVDDYVFGYAMRNREQAADRRHLEQMAAYLQKQLDTGEFPHLAQLLGDDPGKGVERVMHLASDEQRFERGLQRLLDGIALDIERRRTA